VPDLDEGVVHRSAGGSVQDSKVHEQFYSPIVVAMRAGTSVNIEGSSRLRLPDILTNKPVTDIVGTLNDLGGSETGRLKTGKSGLGPFG